MNQEEIKQLLPHRDAMLLVEEVEREGEVAFGSYHVRGDEWFLQGHFPGNPVVPGVILCEMMAQSTCVLLADKMTAQMTPMFAGLKEVHFKKPVRPGDTLLSECRIERAKHPFYFATATGRVGDEVRITARFSFVLVEN